MSAMLKGQLVNSLAFEQLKAVWHRAEFLAADAEYAVKMLELGNVETANNYYRTRVLASLDALGELAGQLRGEGK